MLYMSPSCERITGYTPEEFIRNPDLMDAIIHPEDRHLMEQHQETVTHGDGELAHQVEFRILRRDGEIRWIGHTCQAIRRSDGTSQGRRGVNRDVTERKEAEAALRESEERYHVTLMSVGEGVITTDPEGKVNLLNAVAEQLTGWSQAEAVGRPLEEVFHIVNELTREGVESPVRRVVREGVVVGLANSTILIARDGVERPIADSGAPVHDENGKLLGVVLVFRDQTEERRQQEMLRESEERYRSTLENMLEGCQIIGYDWRYLYVNEAAARHGRKTRDELLGRTMMEAYPGIEETAMFSMLRRCMQEREPAYLENRFAFPDGSARWFELNMQPVPEGVFILSIDITERKEAEEALRESEERYRSLFTQVPAGLYRTALDGRVIDVNPALVGILGYPDRETLLAVRSPDLYASPERRRELLARLERDGVVRGFETDLLRYDGEKIWVVADASLSRDSTGQPVMEGSITDITERRRAEERVRRLLAQQTTINALALALGDSRGLDEVYSTIYEHVCALMDAPFFAVASYDSEGQAIRPNCVIAEGRVLDTSGFPPASLEEEGRAMQSRVMRTGEPVYLPELPDALKAIWRSDSDGVDCSLPEGTPPEDGEKPGRSGLFVPMKVGGQIVGLMHVQSCRPDAYSPEDISLLDGLANVAAVAIQNARLYAELETYSRGLEQAVEERTAELQAANEALKELDRMKDAFLSTAAHELRTPLTSIRAFSELLLIREFDDEREARYLTMIKTQSQRLADIINDLLDISRLESSQELVFDFRPVDMGALIAETVQPFIDTASEHHFRVEGDKPLPLIQGDTFRLGQVLTNLISNAVKYSSGGSVVIASRVMDTSLEVSVQDEGMGLTPERQAHLFEKFYRAPEVAHIAGSGLGLAICKLIIEKHGGQIWAESESGKGSTFTFTVPLHGDRPSSVR
jgi:PAS domain S-box-containing protein